ncbi:hypothetical protein ACTACB_17620 [Pseudomonas syringae]|uniref:hypothetical protein n=1 Tax=Pseudomonas syringae TaxID=317 RepID=UPI003F760173
MENAPQWVQLTLGIIGILGSLVTAIATIFLWRVTKVLAIETTRMAEASAQPHVVATLAPNRWTLNHFDLHIDNTGNATAYEICTSFDPPLENGEERTAREIPFQRVSVLKPGQGLTSYLSEYSSLKGKKFQVTISWRNPLKPDRETHTYSLDMADNDGVSRLGDDPMVQLASQIKKLQEGWAPIARGSKKVKTDVFTTEDRAAGRAASLEAYDRMRDRENGVTNTDEPAIPDPE